MRNFIECRRLIYMISSRSIHSVPNIRYHLCSSSTNMDLYSRTCKDLNFQIKFLSKIHKMCGTNESRKFSVSCSAYGKEKNRGGKKKAAVVKIDLQEMSQFLNVEKLSSQMESALEDMKSDFIKNLTIRSSTGSIEEVIVTFEEKQYRLQELVQITRKANYVILNASTFPQAIPQILNAVAKSGMNLNPQQDGTKISIPIPKVTKEHRENLSKNAKALFIKCRDNLKDIQNKQLKKLQNNSDINQDSFYRLKAQVEGLCNAHVQEAEKLLKTKQNELLGQ